MPDPNVPSYAWQVVISICCNLIASGTFIFLVLLLGKPIFKISAFICVDPETDQEHNPSNDPKLMRYTFKIVNKSWFAAFDGDVELIYAMPASFTSGGHDNLQEPLNIRSVNMRHVSRNRWDCMVKNTNALFANLVVTNDDIEEKLKTPNSCISLNVVARHGLTGLAGFKTVNFDISKLRPGHSFGSANDCNVYVKQ